MNDLQARLLEFSVGVYENLNPIMTEKFLEPAIQQVIRSSTSVGANYSEAQTSSSYKDFRYKIKIAQKELKETEYWLVYLKKVSNGKVQLQNTIEECIQLLKIFAVIAGKADLRLKLKAHQKHT